MVKSRVPIPSFYSYKHLSALLVLFDGNSTSKYLKLLFKKKFFLEMLVVTHFYKKGPQINISSLTMFNILQSLKIFSKNSVLPFPT